VSISADTIPKKLESNFESLAKIEEQLEVYQENHELFWKEIEKLYRKYELDLVLYDEIEKFREWNDEQFVYPFQDRKTIISEVIMDMAEGLADYEYHS
jgi:hypothetical protein